MRIASRGRCVVYEPQATRSSFRIPGRGGPAAAIRGPCVGAVLPVTCYELRVVLSPSLRTLY